MRPPASGIPIQSLAKVRDRIAAGDAEWKALKRTKLPIEGDSLKRPPRGYACDHPDMEFLKRTDFVTHVKLKPADLCDKRFMSGFAAHCKRMAPLVKFVTHSLDLAW